MNYLKYAIENITPVEFTQQLTLYEHKLWKSISIRQFIKQSWHKEELEINSMINFSNDLSRWISVQIIMEKRSENKNSLY